MQETQTFPHYLNMNEATSWKMLAMLVMLLLPTHQIICHTMNENRVGRKTMYVCVYFIYFTLKMFLSDATNWLLCLNKLVHFIFPLYFHTSHIFRVFRSESVSLSVCVCELSNHFAVHRERKNTETPVLCCTSFLSWLFHRIFGMSLPYLCVLRALKLILMAGASEFLFLTTTKCNNEKALGETHLTQSWKNDGKRWRASERMKETNRSESRKEEKDERIGDDGVGTTIPTFPLYAVIMC